MTHSPDEERDGRAFDFSAPLTDDVGLVYGKQNSGDISDDIFDAAEWGDGAAEGERLAAEIVKRWNAHRGLVKALHGMLARYREPRAHTPERIAALNVLAKLGG